MSVNLGDFTDSLRREVTSPDTVSTVGEDTLTGYLIDAFWDAKLDGFLDKWTADTDGVVLPLTDLQVVAGSESFAETAYVPGVDLGRDRVSLIVLYAGAKMLRNRILNTPSSFKAKAGDVEYERQTAASVLSEMLKQIRATQDRLLTQSETYAITTSIAYVDAVATRLGWPDAVNPAVYYPHALGS